MQDKYAETWVAVLDILFNPISWKISEEEEEERLYVIKEKISL